MKIPTGSRNKKSKHARVFSLFLFFISCFLSFFLSFFLFFFFFGTVSILATIFILSELHPKLSLSMLLWDINHEKYDWFPNQGDGNQEITQPNDKRRDSGDSAVSADSGYKLPAVQSHTVFQPEKDTNIFSFLLSGCVFSLSLSLSLSVTTLIVLGLQISTHKSFSFHNNLPKQIFLLIGILFSSPHTEYRPALGSKTRGTKIFHHKSNRTDIIAKILQFALMRGKEMVFRRKTNDLGGDKNQGSDLQHKVLKTTHSGRPKMFPVFKWHRSGFVLLQYSSPRSMAKRTKLPRNVWKESGSLWFKEKIWFPTSWKAMRSCLDAEWIGRPVFVWKISTQQETKAQF